MKIGSVIVTFNPNTTQFKQVLDAVTGQVESIKVVDNGSSNIIDIWRLTKNYNNVTVEMLNDNFGIAEAQNIGVRGFESLSYDWVLTLDQDTIIPFNYVEQLKKECIGLKNAGIITGAYMDIKWNATEVCTIRSKRTPRVQRVTEEISSGNLVLVQAWQEVGGFDERLFIDYV
ncbi:glycosyltransferase, partial [Collinsella aerofaciens]